ncbi:MAG: ABC transporter substrate-binding protein [Acidimicrobiia bacterium]|nr:ABC transporter substrate-binding protein [Acidimicrobiia bacterium]
MLAILVLAATACGTSGPGATPSTEPPTSAATTTTAGTSRPTTTTSVRSSTTSTSTATIPPTTTSTAAGTTTTTAAPPLEVPETVEIVISEPAGIRTLDPTHSDGSGRDAPVLTTVYETLAWTSPSGEVLPRLATGWTISQDRRTYTFHLRQGVRFHNGADFTAEDVVYSVTRAFTGGSPVVRQRTRNLRGVTAADDYTVVFELREPSNAFLFDVADPTGTGFASILTETAPAHGEVPVGTGPFRFVSHVPGSELVLEPNPDYWDPSALPGYELLRVHIIEDEGDRVATLEAGEVGLIRTDTTEVAALLAGNPLLEVVGTPAWTIWLHAARTGSTADGAVVRAAWLSLDRQRLADLAFAGEAAPWSTSHPLLAYGRGPDELPGYQRDVEAAAQLLAEAGYEHGISLELPYPVQDRYPDGFFEVLVAGWAEAGITVEPVPVDRVTWLARLVTADYDLTVTRHGWYANPYRYLFPRPGWQAPPEEVLPELVPALADLATASDEDRPDAFRRVQLLEAEHGYPFTGVVYVNSHYVYRTDLIEDADPTGSVTGDRRDLYLSLVEAGSVSPPSNS